MPKFRKKPVVVEAFQFHRARYDASELRLPIYIDRVYDQGGIWYYVNTLEGKMNISDGDWIITGVNGEYYPCKPDIFEKSYEAVE